ncbi:hypothetical protein [Clostridium sp.]|uniref:hypothetical protein n=1 Tax=Clostridium sp. TaxID=1506 RepID=UPI001A46B4B6|nr:hypothetical protein [Clostridium sp.]MBK5243095.1 hypothetical protein [Clostridium sp.]
MSIVKYITVLVVGMAIGFIVTKNQAFINVMRMVNWSVLLFWFTLFLGATIPITVNYFSIKKQEVIKLKAKLAQDKIDILRDYKTFDLFMRMTVDLDKEVSELKFKYDATIIDLTAPSLRGLNILVSHEIYDNWKADNMQHIEKLNGLGSKKISNHTWYMLNYILNLDVLIEDIPNDKMLEISVAVKNDFIDMSNDFGEIIDKYLNLDLYKFKNDLTSKKNIITQAQIANKLNKTNLIKYKEQLSRLKIG